MYPWMYKPILLFYSDTEENVLKMVILRQSESYMEHLFSMTHKQILDVY